MSMHELWNFSRDIRCRSRCISHFAEKWAAEITFNRSEEKPQAAPEALIFQAGAGNRSSELLEIPRRNQLVLCPPEPSAGRGQITRSEITLSESKEGEHGPGRHATDRSGERACRDEDGEEITDDSGSEGWSENDIEWINVNLTGLLINRVLCVAERNTIL